MALRPPNRRGAAQRRTRFRADRTGTVRGARRRHVCLGEDSLALAKDLQHDRIMLAPGTVFRPHLERSPWMRFNVAYAKTGACNAGYSDRRRTRRPKAACKRSRYFLTPFLRPTTPSPLRVKLRPVLPLSPGQHVNG